VDARGERLGGVGQGEQGLAVGVGGKLEGGGADCGIE
jgi:hypothetical protein